jgi:NAD(P)-dependent dehydrogenase (short-subunit alcohol dehydrogenase family)
MDTGSQAMPCHEASSMRLVAMLKKIQARKRNTINAGFVTMNQSAYCADFSILEENNMDLQLTNRKALVTGSTGGIGFAIAQGLAAEGAQVTITGRTQARVDDALARLRTALPRAEVDAVAADAGTAAGAQAVFDRVAEVDILINNLGIYERKPFFEIPDADWQRLFEINVMGGIRFSRHYAPAMAKRGWGRILFVSSESGLHIPREMIHYGMTKTAQLSIARGLAIELAGSGVTVNAILPGPTRTETSDRIRSEQSRASGKSIAEIEADVFITRRPTSLLKRLATPEEVANLAVYLCGVGSSATNGAALRVDGGVVNQIM